MTVSGRCFALAFAVTAYGCSGDELTISPTKGILEVSTATGGVEPDADGYIVQVDGGPGEAIGPAATWRSGELDPGSYTVQLGGLSPNCTVADNPRTVALEAGETATVPFQITCSATTGGVNVTTATGGASPDADGYAVTIDGTDRGAIQSAGTLTVEGLAAGDHSLGLSGVAGNCRVEGTNPRTVAVVAGENVDVAFTVTCETPPAEAGSLHLTTATQGPDQDSDGYAFAVDGGSTQPVGANAEATLTNLAVGGHTVQLSGVAANCAVQGENPRSVTVTAGGTAQVSFAVSCATTTGSVQVDVTTTGDPQDPDGYAVRLDGAAPQNIPTNGTHTFSSVSAGEHSLAVEGVAANCTLEGNNPRTVAVTSGAIQRVSFVVSCATPALTWQTMQSGTDFNLQGVWGSSGSDVFAVGQNPDSRSGESAIFHYDGQSWSRQHTEDPSHLNAVWGSGPNDVFAVGVGGVDGVILHYNGATWSRMAGLALSPPGGQTTLLYNSVWGSSGQDLYAVGSYFDGSGENALIAHYNGSSWTQRRLPHEETRTIQDVVGTSSANVAVAGYFLPPGGEGGFVDYGDGVEWTEATIMGAMFTGAWSASPSDVFVVGVEEGRGVIYHFNGSTWASMQVPATGRLEDVWGSSGTDVYAVGDNAILPYNGSTWTKVHDQGGFDVWGSSASDIFVVGTGGRILRGTR
jgi:hypothetical protein